MILPARMAAAASTRARMRSSTVESFAARVGEPPFAVSHALLLGGRWRKTIVRRRQEVSDELASARLYGRNR